MSRLFSIIIILTLVSCSKDIEPTAPYFKFDTVGEQVLSGLKLNDTLKFAGSNGSHREYKVFEIQKLKQTVQECSWNIGSCKFFYHFDNVNIYFIRIDSTPSPLNPPFTYSFTLQMQLPREVDKNNIPKDVQAKASVSGNAFVDFNGIPPSNGQWTSAYIIYPDFYKPLTFITYSNAFKTYSQVVVLKSGNNAVYVVPYFGTKYTVNEAWFDKKYGFVFFKDVFGNSWSRTN